MTLEAAEVERGRRDEMDDAGIVRVYRVDRGRLDGEGREGDECELYRECRLNPAAVGVVGLCIDGRENLGSP